MASALPRTFLAVGSFLLSALFLPAQDAPLGYYRAPAVHGDTVVFVAEGDLWVVTTRGGTAQRLTTHPAEEFDPAISNDGAWIAFTAHYEGPKEVYVMPRTGGRPQRITWSADGRARVVGWTPDGRVLVSTRRHATIPDQQLVAIAPQTGAVERIPLHQADQGSYAGDGSLVFTRLPFQGSHAKRYRGGYIQNLWRFDGENEARRLEPDFDGISKDPMVWEGRVYFLTDRDGTMNLWSMTLDGSDPQQHTAHQGWDIRSAALSQGRVVYRLGADLHLHDLSNDEDRVIPIRIASDHDHTLPHWVDEPQDFVTSAHLSPDGSQLALTSRGRAFTVATEGEGSQRIRAVPQLPSTRYREARFAADGASVLVFSDETGEAELWQVGEDGSRKRLTENGSILRRRSLVSPDGAWIAHSDKNGDLWVLEVESGRQRLVDDRSNGEIGAMSWSPDSRWLAYEFASDNRFTRLRVASAEGGAPQDVTSDRWDSQSPAWSADGQWLFFLSARNFRSQVGSPWGSRQPEPYFDEQVELFALALQPGLRPPFLAPDELHPRSPKAGEKKEKKDADAANESKDSAVVATEIAFDGLRGRQWKLPVPPGNHRGLVATKDRLLWTSRGDDGSAIHALALEPGAEVETVAEKMSLMELSADGEKVLASGGGNYAVFAAKTKKLSGDAAQKAKVDLSDWRFAIEPREEWRMMFVDAWRMHRDYFYDPGMHGVNWEEMRLKYGTLVDRITDRAELEDLTAMLISELSALHASVRGGELREGPDEVGVGFLGARYRQAGDGSGFVLDELFAADPDRPELRGPLARPDMDVRSGDVLAAINGQSCAGLPDPGVLLRDQVGKPVRLDLRRGDTAYSVVTEPISARAEGTLRYHSWEYDRRRRVEEASDGRVGYVHLQAMGRGDMEQWARDYYPVADRDGLVIDVRHNRGGNIDAWILSRLLRKTWFYWTTRSSKPFGNMHSAFDGHIVVLCDRLTASDGEAFTEGIKRLDIAPVFGTRTWGGEIWLSRENRMVDGGVASAGMMGVYGPERTWLIENRGVEPDVVVDNLPHETFLGRDRQLEAALEFLETKMREEPVVRPEPPAFPDKSFVDNRR